MKDRPVLRTIESPLDDTVPANRRVTLRDLLTFRSGYGEMGFLSPTCPLQRAMSEARLTLGKWPFTVTPDEFLKRLGRLPLAHQPGERWLYHTGAELLGVLIARVCGQSLGTFLRDHIFEPLGMKDTGFHVPETKLDRLPTCYGRDLSTGEVVVLHEARGGALAECRVQSPRAAAAGEPGRSAAAERRKPRLYHKAHPKQNMTVVKIG